MNLHYELSDLFVLFLRYDTQVFIQAEHISKFMKRAYALYIPCSWNISLETLWLTQKTFIIII